MMSNLSTVLFQVQSLDSDTYAKFENNLVKSTSAIVFGSYAAGVERPTSDIDVLFVGNGVSKKTKQYDFLWISPQKLLTRSWLGSELANHIANYGVCVKGDAEWRDHVFLSKDCLTKKQIQIYTRLIHVYSYREKTPYFFKVKHMERAILDFFRLVIMNNGLPVPPTALLVNEFKSVTSQSLRKMFNDDKCLGNVGSTLLEEIFRMHPNRPFFDDVLEQIFKVKY